jgi:hypothetical protein
LWEKLENWASGSYIRGYQCVAVGSLLHFGAVIIAAQVLKYLKDGQWVPFAVGKTFIGAGLAVAAIKSGWIGVLNIVEVFNEIPAAPFLIGIGLVWAVLLFRNTRPA